MRRIGPSGWEDTNRVVEKHGTDTRVLDAWNWNETTHHWRDLGSCQWTYRVSFIAKDSCTNRVSGMFLSLWTRVSVCWIVWSRMCTLRQLFDLTQSLSSLPLYIHPLLPKFEPFTFVCNFNHQLLTISPNTSHPARLSAFDFGNMKISKFGVVTCNINNRVSTLRKK